MNTNSKLQVILCLNLNLGFEYKSPSSNLKLLEDNLDFGFKSGSLLLPPTKLKFLIVPLMEIVLHTRYFTHGVLVVLLTSPLIAQAYKETIRIYKFEGGQAGLKSEVYPLLPQTPTHILGQVSDFWYEIFPLSSDICITDSLHVETHQYRCKDRSLNLNGGAKYGLKTIIRKDHKCFLGHEGKANVC